MKRKSVIFRLEQCSTSRKSLSGIYIIKEQLSGSHLKSNIASLNLSAFDGCNGLSTQSRQLCLCGVCLSACRGNSDGLLPLFACGGFIASGNRDIARLKRNRRVAGEERGSVLDVGLCIGKFRHAACQRCR